MCQCSGNCDCEDILEIPVGPQGPTGPAPNISIGTVTSGGTAAASMSGTSPNYTLNLTLPQASGVTYYYAANVTAIVMTNSLQDIVTLALPVGTYMVHANMIIGPTTGRSITGFHIFDGTTQRVDSARLAERNDSIRYGSESTMCVFTITTPQTISLRAARDLINYASGTGTVANATLFALKLA